MPAPPRTGTIEERLTTVEGRLDALATEMQRGADRLSQAEARFATGERRVTEVEATTREVADRQGTVTTRLQELVGAAQGFTQRMEAVESALVEGEQEPPAEERLAAVEGALAGLVTRLEAVEVGRSRGTRLSSRLASIEEKLDKLAGGGPPNNPPEPI